jgi:23S rRNA (adenine1618-N6)-methyltransferase
MKPTPSSPTPPLSDKAELHPRNRHRGRYDFAQLVGSYPALAGFLGPNPQGDRTIDYAQPAAVKALNAALLRHYYGIDRWDIPAGCLCPPIPGRADYLHHAADLLAEDNGGPIPRGPLVAVLDVGVGANCIYPILGHQEYGWSFVGSETEPEALRNARRIVAENSALNGFVDCRHQPCAGAIFRGILRPGERFELTLCNPPFHASAQEAAAGTQRKVRNLGIAKSSTAARASLNFGGKTNELWCPGGELAFIRRLIAESSALPATALWFTTLVSKAENLPALRRALTEARAVEVRVVPMAQGQKRSRLLAWSFLAPLARRAWCAQRLAATTASR